MEKVKFFLKKGGIVIGAIIIVWLIHARYQRWIESCSTSNSGAELISQEGVPVTMEQIRMIFPQAADFKIAHGPDRCGIVYDEQNREIGNFVCTRPVSDSIIGYAGPVPFIIGFNEEHRITGIALLPNSETAGFIKRLEKLEYWSQWNGLTWAEALEKPIETVSGATMSSSAILQTFRQRVSLLCAVKTAIDPQTGEPSPWRDVPTLLLVVFSLCYYFGSRKWKLKRDWLLLATVGILGFYSTVFLSLSLFWGWTINGMHWGPHHLYMLIFGLALLLPLIFNRPYYCLYLCPFGALQELVAKAGKKIRMKNAPVWFRRLRWLRVIFSIIIVGLLLMQIYFDLAYLEPFSFFALRSVAVFVWILAIASLIASLFVPKFWCSYLCPTGYLLSLCQIKTPKSESQNLRS